MEKTSAFLMDGPPPLANVMLDLETWGTAPGSALRSIGACEFDPHTDQIGETFYANILDQSCLDAGLVMDANTVAWWADPKKAKAADVFAVDPRPLPEVADAFSAWFRKVRGIFVWSQGANFDQPLWEMALSKIGRKAPWKYVDSRCTRTAYDMGGLNPFTIKRLGVHHNALDDAKHQAKCVQIAYRRRNGT